MSSVMSDHGIGLIIIEASHSVFDTISFAYRRDEKCLIFITEACDGVYSYLVFQLTVLSPRLRAHSVSHSVCDREELVVEHRISYLCGGVEESPAQRPISPTDRPTSVMARYGAARHGGDTHNTRHSRPRRAGINTTKPASRCDKSSLSVDPGTCGPLRAAASCRKRYDTIAQGGRIVAAASCSKRYDTIAQGGRIETLQHYLVSTGGQVREGYNTIAQGGRIVEETLQRYLLSTGGQLGRPHRVGNVTALFGKYRGTRNVTALFGKYRRTSEEGFQYNGSGRPHRVGNVTALFGKYRRKSEGGLQYNSSGRPHRGGNFTVLFGKYRRTSEEGFQYNSSGRPHRVGNVTALFGKYRRTSEEGFQYNSSGRPHRVGNVTALFGKYRWTSEEGFQYNSSGRPHRVGNVTALFGKY
ncbi:hypothetical protein J6590_012505 [Homalodisca vitripennis]|nr:hypothetical protein J6590_012505 [Homalodisca vitripennis]